MYMYMYTCVCVYIYIYIYIYACADVREWVGPRPQAKMFYHFACGVVVCFGTNQGHQIQFHPNGPPRIST